MKPIADLIKEEGFLKSIFEAIPCGILVLDRERRIKALNNVLERTFSVGEAAVMDKRAGEALKCVHSKESAKGCGFSRACSACIIRSTALAALDGQSPQRKRANIRILTDEKGEDRDMILLVSAASFVHNGERLAVVILEDVTEQENLMSKLRDDRRFEGIVGTDPVMEEVYRTIVEVADYDVPVLIEGETGTGKELVAAAIHKRGERATGPFVPINCAALPEGVLESELFGHVKGAFTGAVRDKMGRFELADGGTLFLDEVGDLSLQVQARLLRVLQEKSFDRVGGEKPISVDVRIISATNRDLRSDVREGRFRDDLFYRLRVVPILLPPLRERRGDIPMIADHFIKTAIDQGLRTNGISSHAMEIMAQYNWPGNVRELQSAVRYAIVKSGGGIIEQGHLPEEIYEAVVGTKGELRHQGRSRHGHSRKLDRGRVKEALIRTGGNKAKAARILGVGRATLYRFLSDFPDVH